MGDNISLRGSHNFPKYFFTYTNAIKKGLILMSVTKIKKGKAQGSEIMIGFKKRS